MQRKASVWIAHRRNSLWVASNQLLQQRSARAVGTRQVQARRLVLAQEAWPVAAWVIICLTVLVGLADFIRMQCEARESGGLPEVSSL